MSSSSLQSAEVLPKELTGPTLRRGKWTVEEERYTEKIIIDFENGTLDVPEGTTLRSYLSRVLHCDPMRITKKYTGNASIGKRTFTPLVRTRENSPFIDLSQRELVALRRSWLSRLLIAEQWNSRKLQILKHVLPLPAVSVGVGNGDSSSSPPLGLSGEPVLDEEALRSALRPVVASAAQVEQAAEFLRGSERVLSSSTAATAANTTTSSSSAAASLSPEEITRLIDLGGITIPALYQSILGAHMMTSSPSAAAAAAPLSLEHIQRSIRALLQQHALSSAANANADATTAAVPSSSSPRARHAVEQEQEQGSDEESFLSNHESRKRKLSATEIAREESERAHSLPRTSYKTFSLSPSSISSLPEYHAIDPNDRKTMPLEERLRAATLRRHVVSEEGDVLRERDGLLLRPPYNEQRVLDEKSSLSSMAQAQTQRTARRREEVESASSSCSYEESNNSIVSAAEALLGLINC